MSDAKLAAKISPSAVKRAAKPKAIKSVTQHTAVINMNSPKAMSDFAKELKKFVVDNNLYTNIKGKNYVHVEGWQFAGASMGIFPIVQSLENISDGNSFKYRAEVELVRVTDGTVVGYGFALCSNTEDKKKSFDEYAIASMAQTRAVGKAFRLGIGWIMKLAGYEATPAEEIDDVPEEKEPETPKMPLEDVKFIVDTRLAVMPAATKMRFVKYWTGGITATKLTERDYRLLYENLPRKEINE